MAVPSRNPDDIDLAALVQFLNSMQQTLLTQSRNTNNNVANLVKIVTVLQEDIHSLIHVLDLTREKRFEEEINALESQLTSITHQLQDKKSAQVVIHSTSEKIRTVTKEHLEAEARKKRIDWLGVRQVMINAGAGALAVGIIWGIIANLSRIGEAIQVFFGK